jgi:hypothetical protein
MAKEANLCGTTPQGQRLSTEQLTNVLNQVGAQNEQLRQQNAKLIEQLEAFRKNEFYLILDWNYQVVTSDSTLFSYQFKEECAARIEKMLTPPEPKEEDQNPSNAEEEK